MEEAVVTLLGGGGGGGYSGAGGRSLTLWTNPGKEPADAWWVLGAPSCSPQDPLRPEY